jgi:prophage regulatory protein
VKRKVKGEAASRRIIRKPEVERLTGYSAVQIWRLEGRGLFPRRVQLSPMAVGWFEDEVSAWIQSRVRQGGKRPPVRARRSDHA